MKKICYVTTVSMTLEAFVLQAAKYLQKNTDWDITFVCDHDEAFARMLPQGMHYQPIAMQRGISAKGIVATKEMYALFKHEHFDLVQFSTPNASLYAAIASRLAGVPVRLYCQWGMAYIGFRGIKRSVFKAVEKLVCRLATHIEPDSASNLAFAISQGLYPADKGSVVWNGSAVGVDLQRYDIQKKSDFRQEIRKRYGIPPDAFVFGFVGRITRDKGVNELLTAARQLLKAHDQVCFLLVGPDEADPGVDQELLRWARQDEHVRFAGFTHEVEKHYAAMDCFVLPSYREGFGMSVIEAEAMGVPVIVSDIPGPVDGMQAEATGVVVPKADAQALWAAMEQFLTTPERDNGRAARAYAAENFDQTIFLEKMLEDRKKLMGVG